MQIGESRQTGRSMVEMLGVLAIIGVLSVGGISAYSKAMAKFKLTKAQDQISMIVEIRAFTLTAVIRSRRTDAVWISGQAGPIPFRHRAIAIIMLLAAITLVIRHRILSILHLRSLERIRSISMPTAIGILTSNRIQTLPRSGELKNFI